MTTLNAVEAKLGTVAAIRAYYAPLGFSLFYVNGKASRPYGSDFFRGQGIFVVDDADPAFTPFARFVVVVGGSEDTARCAKWYSWQMTEAQALASHDHAVLCANWKREFTDRFGF